MRLLREEKSGSKITNFSLNYPSELQFSKSDKINYMDLKIHYQDADLLIIEKPAGTVVNRARTVKDETIQDWSEKFLGIENDKTDFYARSGIIHRIDKETSGVLLLAKNSDSFFALQKMFKDRLIEKKYLALVHGGVKPKEGTINVPIGRLPWNSERFGVFVGGREALTKYQVISYYLLKKSSIFDLFTLLEVAPHTGRTHQIRVHLKYINHPIVSDEFYAGRKTADKDRKWCPRLFLHAAFIKFKHPKTGKEIEIQSVLPVMLENVLSGLKKINNF